MTWTEILIAAALLFIGAPLVRELFKRLRRGR
jgi:hypothetical protein